MWRARIPSSWRLGSSWPRLAHALRAPARKPSLLSDRSSVAGTIGSEKTKTTALALGGGVTFALATYSVIRPKYNNENVSVPTGEASQYFRLAKTVDEGNLIPYSEVQKHNTVGSCWVVISGNVYDVTSFIDNHPGGRDAILKAAGTDATLTFNPIHALTVLDTLPPEALIGPVDPDTVPWLAVTAEATAEERHIAAARAALPHPHAALNLDDIEALAYQVLTATAWAYYSSAGDDEQTNQENRSAYKRFWFRPRVLNKVSKISTDTTILSFPCSLPIFVAPTALARLGHPGGEVNIVRACAAEGIIQAISNNASCSIEEIMAARSSTKQPLFFQFYMNRNREASEAMLRKVEKSGFDAVLLTVDAAVPGKRERDQRVKGDFEGPAQNGTDRAGAGVGVAIAGYQDPDVCWADIPWIQGITKLPLVIKGIQSVEDAERAFNHGVQGIVLSNHGGRQLDFSPAPMTILQELRERRPDLLERDDFHVLIDGGVRRGTDVLKALCLGARAVGLGRPFLYANGVWGEEGARRVVQIMREEVETGMRLLGVTRLDQLKPEMVRYVDRDPSPTPPQPNFVFGPGPRRA